MSSPICHFPRVDNYRERYQQALTQFTKQQESERKLEVEPS